MNKAQSLRSFVRESLIQRVHLFIVSLAMLSGVTIATLLISSKLSQFSSVVKATSSQIGTLIEIQDGVELNRVVAAIGEATGTTIHIVQNGRVVASNDSLQVLDTKSNLVDKIESVSLKSMIPPVVVFSSPVELPNSLGSGANLVMFGEVSKSLLIAFLALLTCLLLGAVFSFVYKRYVDRQLNEILVPLANIRHAIMRFDKPSSAKGVPESRLYELNDIRESLIRVQAELVDAQKFVSMGELAAQVAHDIRSPLGALMIAIEENQSGKSDHWGLIKAAAERIQSISEDLHSRSVQWLSSRSKREGKEDGTKVDSVFIYPLVERIIAEKRIELTRMNKRIEIVMSSKGSKSMCAKVHSASLQRVISNLINNSIEAISNEGRVSLELSNTNETVCIRVKDNGRGIPKHVISKVTQKGETFGKSGGTGLGLYHAKTSIVGWGGEFGITSEAGKGTTVRLGLINSNPPDIYLDHLSVFKGQRIGVLDDDPSILEAWRERLKPFEVEVANIASEGSGRLDVYDRLLVDYHLGRGKENGIEWIQRCNAASKAILVTTLFDASVVVESAREFGIKIISKDLLRNLNIYLANNDIPKKFEFNKGTEDATAVI